MFKHTVIYDNIILIYKRVNWDKTSNIMFLFFLSTVLNLKFPKKIRINHQ